ncbi:type II secretion system protein N [Sulfurirhabdus autotrophica]|uniref:Type II secretion system protein C (GspC) n=1 Tax=Sulfurirhabdus autotrophica TaxID=1706046 RepID=A0A4R3XUN2_9PROT|nr:type II secretion system protein N [Sulfurirhabdus autotrophica]TCV83405.1 type II secretion system protein C (GspC) [Sulfurirhabdus autotrophica]
MSGMQDLNILFRNYFQARGVLLLSGGLVVLLCWFLAQWTWLVITPKTHGVSFEKLIFSAQDSVNVIISSQLYGGVGYSHADGTLTLSNYKLHGVYSANDSQLAFAIIAVDGKPDQPFLVGDEISQSSFLNAVYPDYVEIRRQGKLERLDLDIKFLSQSVDAADATEFNLNVRSEGAGNFSFSRKELTKALQNPKQLKVLGNLAKPPHGSGIAVNTAPKGSLAQKLGLQQGDLILAVNGQVASNMGIINQLYQQLNEIGQVKLQCLRNGQTLYMNYTVQQ